MAHQRLICLLAGLIVAGGSFAWLNLSNALHAAGTIIVEYELEPRAGRPPFASIAAELRYGAGPDEAAHGRTAVQLDAPNIVPLGPASTHVIRVERIGQKRPASNDSQVWIHRALADGEPSVPETHATVRIEPPVIELGETGAAATFRGGFRSFELELLRHEWSGFARVQLDGAPPIDVDLFSPNRGSYDIRFESAIPVVGRAIAVSIPHRALHRLALRALDPDDRFRVTGLLVQIGGKLRRVPLDPSPPPGSEWRYDSARGLTAMRHRTLTSVHVTLALLFGCAAAALVMRLTSPRPLSRPGFVPVSAFVITLVFGLLLAQTAFWLLSAWPAFLTTDSFSVWQQTQDLYIDTWLSHTYVLFVLMTRQLWDSPATLSVIQVALSLLIAGGVFVGLLRRGLRAAAVLPFVILFAVAVPIGAYSMYHTRDTLFGLMAVAIGTVIYFWGWQSLYRPPYAPSPPQLLALAVLAGSHASVRAEGVLVLLLLPLALWLIVRVPLRRVVAFAAISGGIWFALGAPLIRALGVQSSPFYGLTTKLDPLGEIVSAPYNTDDPARDRAIIEKVVPLEDLKRRHKNIEVFWNGSIDTTKISLADLKEFNQLYATLVRRNFTTFLANRWDNFARLCCSDDQFNIGSILSLDHGPELNEHRQQLGLNEYAQTPFPGLRDLLQRVLTISLRVDPQLFDWRSIIWNLWPGVVLTIAAMLAFRRIPVTAMVALLVGYRIAVIFGAAPASMFKYLYDVYFLGFFLVPMALLELGARSPRLARLFMRRTNP